MVEYDEEDAEYEEYDEYEDEEYEDEEDYDEEEAAGGEGRHLVEKILLALLIGLSVGGVAVADYSAANGLKYWLAVVPVFALASTFVSWKGARADGVSVLQILGRQLFHWTPLALAIYFVFFLEQAGRLNRDDAGLVSLLLLTVSTLLAGVHFDWRIFVVGALLGVTTACVSIVEEFLWWILAGAAVVAAAAVYLWPRRRS
jgi:hypothetical protein